jgi:hypothetical protein
MPLGLWRRPTCIPILYELSFAMPVRVLQPTRLVRLFALLPERPRQKRLSNPGSGPPEKCADEDVFAFSARFCVHGAGLLQ